MRHPLTTTVTLMAPPCGLVITTVSACSAQRLLAEGTSSGGDPAAAIAGLASLLTAIGAGWLTFVLILALATRLPGQIGRTARQLLDHCTPALVRRWAAIALGASVTATVLPGTAVAAAVRPEDGVQDAPAPGWHQARTLTTGPTDLPGPGWAPPSSASSTPDPSTTGPAPHRTLPVPVTAPGPGWTPRRPPVRQRSDPHLLTGRHRSVAIEEVVVRRGDTLWSIASHQLGPEASAIEISRAWPRWYAANRSLIGPDPHLLLPGTRLTPPTHHHDPGTVPATKGTP